MPALYDEVWCARIQYERVKLALESLGVMKSPREPEQETPVPENDPPEVPPIKEIAQPESPPLIEGDGGQLTLF